MKYEKIVYITAQSPLVSIETFILTEMLSLTDLGAKLIIVPRDGSNKYFHKKANLLLENILSTPWFNVRIAKEFLKFVYKNPKSFFEIIHEIVLNARNPKIAIKNLTILPKSLYLSTLLQHQQPISHIHAHRGSTPSTMAYIIAKMTGIPWSFTVHRFDIYENNILKKKAESASFIRCISEKGRTDLLGIIGDNFTSKVKMIHMGVEVPHRHKDIIKSTFNNENNFKKMCTFNIPGNLLPVKGHMYLLKACNILMQRGFKFKCIICGEGPLKEKLKSFVKNNLSGYVDFYGVIPHEQLICMYKERIVDIVILPSITTENGEFEGIPVSLMEAMAFGIPVISTNTGSIPEIIGDGSGVMVKEKDPETIAISIEKLMNDKTCYNLISERGRGKIERDFNISIISKQLLKLFLQYSSH